MNTARWMAVLPLLACASCAADLSDVAPARGVGFFPVQYELRTGFADEPAFDSEVATGPADPAGRRVRVIGHLAWLDDRLADRLFASSDTGLFAQALERDEGQRLIEALADKALTVAEVPEGERAELSDLDEKTYLVGWDIDVTGALKDEKSHVREAGSGAVLQLVARVADASELDIDATFDLLVANIAFSAADLPPDRVGVMLDIPVIVGQRVHAHARLPVGGTLVLGGFRLMAPLRMRGSEWIAQSLSATLVAFVTVELADDAEG